MQKTNKKIIIFALIAFLFAILFFCFLLFKIRHDNVFNHDATKLTERRMNIFAPPSIAERMVDSIKKYSARKNTKISLLVLPERELEDALINLEEPGIPLVFVGYALKEEDESDARVFLRESIVGVTNDLLFDKCQNAKCDIVVDNLCQTYRIAKKRNLELFFSENFLPSKNHLIDIYKNDCEKICLAIAKKMKILDNAKIKSDHYIVMSRGIMPNLLLSGDFVQREFFGTFVYFDQASAQGLLSEVENNTSAFLDRIGSEELNIFVNSDFLVEFEEVKEAFLDGCRKEIADVNFDLSIIKPGNFFDKKGILFGIESDVINFGTLVYKHKKKFPVWGYCRNDSEFLCQKFLRLASCSRC